MEHGGATKCQHGLASCAVLITANFRDYIVYVRQKISVKLQPQLLLALCMPVVIILILAVGAFVRNLTNRTRTGHQNIHFCRMEIFRIPQRQY